MKIILFLTIAMTALSVNAQQTVKVSYNVSKPIVMQSGISQSKMTLVSSADKSLYYNTTSMYVDSLSSTPEGKAELKRLLGMESVSIDENGQVKMNINENIHKKEPLYVAKNFADGSLSVFDKWYNEDGTYREPLDEMKWTIVEDSTKKVLGYECFMATTDYHGRTWKAWFTPEIPLHDGPWKFRNLPGLILKAEAPDGAFSFEATGIENLTGKFPQLYGREEYQRVDRKKALAGHEKYLDNLENQLKAQYGPKAGLIVVDNNGKVIEKHKFDRQRDAIETDY